MGRTTDALSKRKAVGTAATVPNTLYCMHKGMFANGKHDIDMTGKAGMCPTI